MTADSASSPPSRTRRLLRWVGVPVAGLVIVLLASAWLIPQLVPSSTLRKAVEPPLEAAVGQPVQLGSIELQVLPWPAVRAEDVRIANPEGFGAAPMMHLQALRVEVALWPLFSGTIRPTSVVLVAPVVRYIVAESGRSNIDALTAASDTSAAASGGGGAPSLVVEDFRIEDAELLYTDRATGQSARLAFGAQLQASTAGSAVASTGTVRIAALQAVLPETSSDTLALRQARIAYDVRAALDSARIGVRRLDIQTPPLTLSTKGSLRRINAGPVADLSFAVTQADLSQLAALLPPKMLQDVQPRGALTLDGSLVGPLDSLDVLRLRAAGQLRDIGVDYQETAVLRGLTADVALSLDTMAVRSMRGQLLNEPLRGTLAAHHLRTDTPRLRAALSGGANLAALASLSETSTDIAGNATYDLTFAGPATDPGSGRLTGTLALNQIRYPTTALRHPLEIPEGTVRFTGTGLQFSDLPLRSGDQSMTLSAEVRQLLPIEAAFAERNPALNTTFALRSERLDLVELLPEPKESDPPTYADLFTAQLAGAKINGRDPAAIAREQYGDVTLPEMTVNGSVALGVLLNEPQRFENLSMDIRAGNRRMAIRNLSGQTYGGQLAGGMTLDQTPAATQAAARLTGTAPLVAAASSAGGAAAVSFAPAPATALSYDIQLKDAQAGAFLKEWTRLGSIVTGTLDLNMTGGSGLGSGLLPNPNALRADGRSIVVSGGLDRNFGVVGALTEALGFQVPSFTDFKRLGGSFTIRNGALQIDDWALQNNRIQSSVSGAMGLGGQLDLRFTMQVPTSMIEGSKLAGLGGSGLSGLLGRLSGKDKTVEVTVRMGGTVSNPQPAVDTDAFKQALQDLARDAGGLIRGLFNNNR
ncbi:AsmA family protein [Salisaeta longa]|uniref:AsmA family protein n=1 Tax=Salisaeta longa TaxID=503170 RepID=UPI0003B4410C|nr:AsmA family protein [Salisaeta longa]